MASATRSFARAAMRTTTRQSFGVAAPRVAGRRYYSSEAPKSSSSNLWMWLSGAAVAGGAGSLYYLNQGGVPVSATPKIFTPTKEDYQEVYNLIAQRLEEKDDYDDGSYGPVLVRLAWHCSGTFDAETGTGGSNGATMRFAPEADHGANAGLKHARDFLEPVKGKFPT
jgi:cytochrome c peroxidase